MSDLTDADLEAMEKRCEKELEGPWPHVIYPAHARSDVPALIAALREARGARDEGVARVKRLEKVAEAAKALRSEHRADFMDDGARQDRLYELFQLLDEHDEAAALAEIDAGEGDDE